MIWHGHGRVLCLDRTQMNGCSRCLDIINDMWAYSQWHVEMRHCIERPWPQVETSWMGRRRLNMHVQTDVYGWTSLDSAQVVFGGQKQTLPKVWRSHKVGRKKYRIWISFKAGREGVKIDRDTFGICTSHSIAVSRKGFKKWSKYLRFMFGWCSSCLGS